MLNKSSRHLQDQFNARNYMHMSNLALDPECDPVGTNGTNQKVNQMWLTIRGDGDIIGVRV